MKAPLIRQGEGQTAAILRHHKERQRERARFEKVINLIVEDNAPALNARAKSIGTAPGDRQKIRGIPAVGVGGAIPGEQGEAVHVMQQKPYAE